MNIKSNAAILPVKIKPDFKPETKLALSWQPLASGNYACTDRGTASDKFEVDISFYGTEATINTIIDYLKADREQATNANTLTLSGFNATEHIFGADIDYSGNITAAVLNIDPRAQHTWKGWGLSMRLAALSPSFVGGSGTLPGLRLLDVGYQADAEYTVDHLRAYNSAYVFHQDKRSDSGAFTGTFTLADSEMIQFRAFVRSTRGASFSLPAIAGVANPFGRLSSSYPYTVKITNFEDQGMLGVLRWKASVTFAEQLS